MKALFLLSWMTLAAITEVRPRSHHSCPPPGSPSYAGGKACDVIISPGGVGCTTAIEYLNNTPSQLGGNLFSDTTLKKHGQPRDFKDHRLCSNMLFIYVLGSVKHSLLSHLRRTYFSVQTRILHGDVAWVSSIKNPLDQKLKLFLPDHQRLDQRLRE